MNSAPILLLFIVQIIAAFSITNKFNIDNLTTTPELRLNIDDSQIRVDFDELNHKNETIDVFTELYTTSIEPPNGRRQSITTKHQSREKRSFFGLIIIPYIICFFASKGFWPFYPPMLNYQVNEMGKKIFALSDDRIRQFCRQKFNFQETCYRPVVYKGYFVPVDGTDCPPLSTAAASTAPPAAAQTWEAAPARVASKSKPPRNGVQQNTDIEVFNAEKTSTMPPADKGKQPNINIEIHNVFSFGASNSSSYPPRETTDSKITVSQNDQKDPPILYA